MRTHAIPLAAALAAVASAAQAPERPFPPLDETRRIDGSENHPLHRHMGAAHTAMARAMGADYADDRSIPSGADRASARHLSSAAALQDDHLPAASGISDMFWQWGQFLDHDVTETPLDGSGEAFPIQVPAGDPWFDPFGTGSVTIPLTRSEGVEVDGVRQQVNGITAWIDGSQVYGSEDERAHALRTMDGTGRLRTSAGDLLPFNTTGLPNAPSAQLADHFVAGDIRANEQIGLTTLHTIFVREHNFWADYIRERDSDWVVRVRLAARIGGGRGSSRPGAISTDADLRPLTGDEVYELARAIVSAELQLVTYREWLPILLGEGVLDEASVYDASLDGSIQNEFATAAFRIGHSMLSGRILRLDASGAEDPAGHVPLAGAFFAPDVFQESGVDPIVRGLLNQAAQELDVFVIDSVRNFLFGPPGAGGFDLVALNIQRGRDHGLPSYGDAREALGLGAAEGFADITSNPSLQAALAASARSPRTLDLWIGGIAEDDVPGAMVGPVFHSILTEQFRALRDGDRLWYSRQLSPRLIELVESQSFADILERTTGLDPDEVRDPFRVF